MKLIVGLGNPGTKYEKTRHNLGAMVVEQFLKDFEPVQKTVWTLEGRFKSDIVELEWLSRSRHSGNPEPAKEHPESDSGQARMTKVLLVKPKTYMNNSGLSIKLLTTYYKLPTTNVWVVHDDIDLPLGRLRIRFGGSSAGQKGVESIITVLKTDKFWRFRMGIGKESSKLKVQSSKLKNVEDYVLGAFVGGQWGKARKLIKKGAVALADALEHGLESTQNTFN